MAISNHQTYPVEDPNKPVQIRAIVLPKAIHEQVKEKAKAQRRTITAQAEFDLISLYGGNKHDQAQSA